MSLKQVQTFPDERLLIVTFADGVTAKHVRQAAEACAIFADELGEGAPIVVIADLSEMSVVSFGELLEILRDQGKGEPGTASDPRLRVLLVGTHMMGKLYADAMRQTQNGGVTIPIFTSMEGALESMRIMRRSA